MLFQKPVLYPIFDTDYLVKSGLEKEDVVRQWKNKISLLQLRCKNCSLPELESWHRFLKTHFPETEILINDYWEYALENDCGFHIGKEDYMALTTAEKEKIRTTKVIRGTSSHSTNDLEFLEKFWDYSGIGPAFPTSSKKSPYPVLGTEFFQNLKFSRIPLVAIGGIAPENLSGLLQEKPVSIAAIGSLMEPGEFGKMYDTFHSFFID